MYGSEIPNWLGVFLVFRNLHTRTDEDGRARERENERKGKTFRSISIYVYLIKPPSCSEISSFLEIKGGCDDDRVCTRTCEPGTTLTPHTHPPRRRVLLPGTTLTLHTHPPRRRVLLPATPVSICTKSIPHHYHIATLQP
jgi:hypothetical protein